MWIRLNKKCVSAELDIHLDAGKMVDKDYW